MQTASGAATAANVSAENAAGSKAAAGNFASAAEESKQAAGASEVKAAASEQAAKASEQAAEKVLDDAKTAQKGAEAARDDVAAKSAEAAAKSEANAKQSADTLAESVENVVANTAAVAELKQQVKNITPDDSTIGEKPWSSKHIVDMLCPPLEESGNPVVCYPVAGYALGVKASWEPMQEGTGTPYPAGGGPNKLNVAGIVSNRTISGITFTVNADGTIGVNGTSTSVCFLNPNTKFNKAYLQKIPAGTYRLDFAQTPLSIFLFGYYEDGSETPIVYAGNVVTYVQDAYVGPQIRVAAGATVNTTARLMLHTGASTPSAYAGWENIRPIKGRDAVTVERCGENLLKFSKQSLKFTQYLGPYAVNLKAGTYYLSCGNVVHDGKNDPVIAFTDEELITYYFLTKGKSQIVKLDRDCTNIYLYANHYDFNGSAGITATIEDFMLVAGTTAPTTYTPYIGQTATLTLPETVYGGEVDAVSSEGQETQKLVILNGTESWNSWGINAHNPAITGFYTYDINDYDAINSKGICSRLETPNQDVWGGRNAGIGFATVGSSRYFMFSMMTSSLPDISAGHEVASLKAYLAAQNDAGTPVQIAYKLAEPVPFTATGAQPLSALAGVNTVLTDADSATVTGRADPIKRITDSEDAVASIN